jgi:NAD(P)-dependent dehydrogenase (short-subunit alcohol dehydrogenase family)
MDLGLEGKRAFVSGSTAGIGFAIARGLAREGARVVVNGRTETAVAAAVRRIGEETGATAEGIAADLGTAGGVEAAVARLGTVDILVNNLGIFEPKPFQEISDADWSRFFEVNVMSGVRLSRALLPAMLERNWGRILFVSSESGVNIPVEMIHYGVTKTAQLAVSRGLAEAVAGTGVTVNAILPGPTRSEGVGDFVASLARDQHKSAAEVEQEFFRTARPSSLIKRFAEVDEVANLAVYLSGTVASATTGAALRVDGGVVRSIV